MTCRINGLFVSCYVLCCMLFFPSFYYGVLLCTDLHTFHIYVFWEYGGLSLIMIEDSGICVFLYVPAN